MGDMGNRLTLRNTNDAKIDAEEASDILMMSSSSTNSND